MEGATLCQGMAASRRETVPHLAKWYGVWHAGGISREFALRAPCVSISTSPPDGARTRSAVSVRLFILINSIIMMFLFEFN